MISKKFRLKGSIANANRALLAFAAAAMCASMHCGAFELTHRWSFNGDYADSISGSAPETSHIWAREAAPFKGIVLRNIDVPAQFECVNAEVKVEGGSMSEKALSADEAAERRNNIENGKHLLY